MAIFFFCGIGGIGMSSIALYLRKSGHTVCGSDRSFDRNTNQKMREMLQKSGIKLFPQDGSGVSGAIDTFVVSTAVEESIPDVKVAREKGLVIRRRAEVLADILHAHIGIAIAGTSGKTTVTAMVGHILHETGHQPLMINGGISVNTYDGNPPSNMMFGTGAACVIEADESDGSIELYHPDIAVVTNISLDHKPLDVIRPLFRDFINRAKQGAVINRDDAETRGLDLTSVRLISFSADGDATADLKADTIRLHPNGIDFDINGIPAHLDMIGRHNVENALAAIGACFLAGVSVEESVRALASFKGTGRRMQIAGVQNGVTVYDDYAHNPAKIQAALRALKDFSGRIFAIFQPHGFAPTRLMKEALVHMLSDELTDDIVWIMPDIYYAGGTVAKDISSRDIIEPLSQTGKKAFYMPSRDLILSFLKQNLRAGDRVIVMGARDDSLSRFAEQIAALKGAA